MSRDNIILLLEKNAYQVWSACLNGHKSSHKKFEELKNYDVGDLVMEISTVGFKKMIGLRIGRLKKITREPFPNWNGEDGEENPGEKVHYVELLFDGREFRWTNANFIKVSEEMFDEQ